MAVRTLFCALALLLSAAACGDGEDRPGAVSSKNGSASGSVSAGHEDTKAQFKEPDATTRLDVAAADFVFRDLPSTAAGPNIFFTVKNTGTRDHEFEVVGGDGEPLGEIASFDAGVTRTLALKMQPGTYTIQCLVKEGDKTHAELGMKATLTVS